VSTKPTGNRKRDDLSPVPAAASRSVPPSDRPPPRSRGAAAPPRGRLAPVLRGLSLLAGVLVVVVACAGVAWGARRYVLTSPRFAIRTVIVDGTARRTPAEVAEAGQIRVSDNVFALDLDDAKARIEADPWIASAILVRKLPSTVEVSVVEHEAHALVSIAGEVYLATRDGLVFKSIGVGDPMDLPVVTGIVPEQVVTDRAGVELSVKRALDVADELASSEVGKRYPLQEIHLASDGSLTATIGREGIVLNLGQPPFKGKIAQADRVLAEVRRKKARASVVFLDNEGNPDRVVVRMR
jgi:cell division protein FtsQ